MASRVAEDHLMALVMEHEHDLVLTTQEAATYRHLLLACLDALATCTTQRLRLLARVHDQQRQIAQLMGLTDDASRE